MGLYFNGKKVRNLYYNGKCITRLALGKEMTRLVEGDDFVRAKWLVGDGNGMAYIDTGIIVNTTTLNYETKINIESIGVNGFICGSRNAVTTGGTENTGIIYIYYNNTPSLRLDVITKSVSIPTGVTEITIQFSNIEGSVILNGVTYIGVKRSSNSSNTFRIFDEYVKFDTDIDKCFRGKMSCFRLNDGTHSLSLTPVRLLRPIPSALDANGIARNADECGMFDAVSGLFYGNVNTGGTFTVSDN